MDLRQLRYFVGIVQAGSLARAADQLHVAQSAVSHHLKSLESELDRQLVTRGPKGIIVTEAGAALYGHAEAILRLVEFAKWDATSVLNVPSGGLRRVRAPGFRVFFIPWCAAERRARSCPRWRPRRGRWSFSFCESGRRRS